MLQQLPPTKQETLLPPTRTLLAVACLMAALYTGFVIMYANGAHAHSRLSRELFLWPNILSLMVLYMWGYRTVGQLPPTKQSLWIVLGGMGLLGILCWCVQPFHSTDVFGYINRGWQQVGYGTNPYTTTIGQLPGWQTDPMLTNHWVNNPCPYGFGFAHVARWLCQLGSGDKLATLGWVKASHLLLLWLATGWAGWVQAKHHGIKATLTTVYTLGWHPLLLLHHIANGHNDLWLGALLAVALGVMTLPKTALPALLRPLRWGVAMAALVASALMKIASIVIVPVLWIGWCAQAVFEQHHRKKVVLAPIITVVIGLLIGWPYWLELADFNQTGLTTNALVSHGSVHSVLLYGSKEVAKLLAKWFNQPWGSQHTVDWLLAASGWLRYGLLALFGAGCTWAALQLWPQAKEKSLQASTLWGTAFAVFVVALCLVNPKFYPWYLGMVLPAAMVLPNKHPLRGALLWVSIAQLLGFTVLGQARIADALTMTVLPIVLWWWFTQQHSPPTDKNNCQINATNP